MCRSLFQSRLSSVTYSGITFFNQRTHFLLCHSFVRFLPVITNYQFHASPSVSRRRHSVVRPWRSVRDYGPTQKVIVNTTYHIMREFHQIYNFGICLRNAWTYFNVTRHNYSSPRPHDIDDSFKVVGSKVKVKVRQRRQWKSCERGTS